MAQSLLEQIELERGTSVPDKKLATDSSRIRRRFLRGEAVNSGESRLVAPIMKGMKEVGFKFERAKDAPEWRVTNTSHVPRPRPADPRKRSARKAAPRKATARKTRKVTARKAAAPAASRTNVSAPLTDLRLGQTLTVSMLQENGAGVIVSLRDGNGQRYEAHLGV